MHRMQLLFGAAALSLGGCAGIQGGNEGEEGPRCAYDTVQLEEPEAMTPGFDRPPAEILQAATGRLDGSLERAGVSVSVSFEPDLAQLSARYAAAGYPADCGPHLDAPAQARLWVGESEAASMDGAMELRWGVLLATARFVADVGSPLESVAPRFSSTPLAPPVLEVRLTEFEANNVRSEWSWTASVKCVKQPCSGGPNLPPGGREEVISWGQSILTRE